MVKTIHRQCNVRYSDITSIGRNFSGFFAPSMIRDDRAPVPMNICSNAKEWDNYPKKTRDSILDQLRQENMQSRITSNLFTIMPYNVNYLPMTSVEQDLYCRSMSPKDFKWEMNNVTYFVKEFRKKGYDSSKPIMLEIENRGLNLSGGNHRVQAIRNMIRDKEFPKDFKVPAIIICPKK